MVHVRTRSEVALVPSFVRGGARDGGGKGLALVPAAALGVAIVATLALPIVKVTNQLSLVSEPLSTYVMQLTFPSIYFSQ